MKGLSLRWKTILGVAGIELVLLLLLVSLTLGEMRDSSNDALVKRANTVAKLFATTSKDATLSYDLASLESFVKEVMTNPDIVYARVVGPDGRDLASAGTPQTDALGFEPDYRIESVTDGIFDASSPIIEGGGLYGSVQIGVSIDRIAATLADIKRWSYSIIALEMGLVGLFSFLLGSYLTGQLATLRQAARDVANDAMPADLPVKRRDEIGEVAIAFNKMVSRLKESRKRRDEYERELEELNETLEQRVEERTSQLQQSMSRLEAAKADLEHEKAVREKAEAEMRQAQKLEAVGQLAAGIAHEINTPVQYIGDSVNFVREAVTDLNQYCDSLERIALSTRESELAEKIRSEIDEVREECDFEYLNENTPMAIERAIKGIERISEIVSAMKTFGVARNTHKEPADINQAIRQSVIVSRHEHRHFAEVEMNLDPDLPDLNCRVSDISQVFLHMVVNAAHAIADRYGEGGPGLIEIESDCDDETVTIRISDNGNGMSAETREKVFDPFFTTKEVGRGTGQGLSIAYDTIVNGHGGTIGVESVVGKGTEFTIRLPKDTFEFRQFLKSDSLNAADQPA